ncbi:Mammalian cell entry related domain protein OS=Tsukamurella paurometabola (strain ATCC 8368 / DSM / CCUG 35730 / CIP 100753 / JCM 10117 / KCTC 9821 / NBRC 16120 / NCIMB 702349 / NCTC 13040) OX=521096 GN=Tpau_1242 PE=4 SV=1 [Tsukamurella paurometabola]
MQRKMNLFNRPMPTATQERRNQLNWGVFGAVATAIILLIAGYLFVFQPGTKEYSADFKEAQAVQSGVDVRVAGISVGKVSDVELLDDRVRVKFRVDNNIFLGDATTVSMKMLTTVGGYYMALSPMGTSDLGSKPIPPERVSMPYSLLETFQAATPKVEKVQATPIRQSMSQLNEALEQQPESIRNTVGTFNRMLDNILRQQDQAGDFVKVMAEYSTTVNQNGQLLLSLMRNMSMFFAAAEVNLAGFKSYLTNTTQLVQRLAPLLNVYLNNVDPLASRFDALVAKARELVKQAEPAIQNAKDMLANLQKTICTGRHAPDQPVGAVLPRHERVHSDPGGDLLMRKFLASRGAMSALVVIVAVVAVVGGFSIKNLTTQTQAYCAELDNSVGLYKGNTVAQFGYPIGKITDITPNGATTRVDFEIPADRKLPTNVGVVAVADSLVAQRRIELLETYKGGPTWQPGKCITNSKTPLSITESLQAVSKVVNDLTKAGGDEEFKKAMASIPALNKATQGTGPEISEATNKLGELMRNPGPGMGDVAAILDAFAPASDGLVQNWGEMREFFAKYAFRIKNVGEPLMDTGIGAFPQLVPLLKTLSTIFDKYGAFIAPLLEVTVPATTVLAATSKQFGDLLNILPPLIRAFQVSVDKKTLATKITYRPPSSLVPSKNPAQTCNNLNRFAPGQCTVADPGHVNVDLISTVLRGTGAAY